MSSDSIVSKQKCVVKSSGGCVIGAVKNGVFEKRIRPEHFLYSPPAISFDVQALRDAQKYGAQRLRVVCADDNTVYETSIEHFLLKCFPVNRGFGKQLALKLSDWNVSGNGSTSVIVARKAVADIRTSQKIGYTQLGLWATFFATVEVLLHFGGL